jgi:hypothetical protein
MFRFISPDRQEPPPPPSMESGLVDPKETPTYDPRFRR